MIDLFKKVVSVDHGFRILLPGFIHRILKTPLLHSHILPHEQIV